MNGIKRFLKKFFIALIVFLFLGAIGYLLFKPKPDYCFNGIKDNNESGVDCGGFCSAACPEPEKPADVQDLKVNWTDVVEDERNNYDLIANISNENEYWGISSMKYEFTYYDATGNELGKKSGNTYVMPKGKVEYNDPAPIKYIIEDNVVSNTPIVRTEIKFYEEKWKELTTTQEKDNLTANVIKTSNAYFEKSKALNVYTGGGISKNTSIYDFAWVDIDVVLFGENNKLLAFGKTNQQTMVSGDGWGFSSLFPNFTGSVSDVKKVDCRAETNVFDPNNIMKNYGGRK